MRLTDRLNLPQKMVIVIAIGVALAAIGVYLVTRSTVAPDLHVIASSKLPAPQSRTPGWQRLIIWLVLDAIWAVASVAVLRERRPS